MPGGVRPTSAARSRTPSRAKAPAVSSESPRSTANAVDEFADRPADNSANSFSLAVTSTNNKTKPTPHTTTTNVTDHGDLCSEIAQLSENRLRAHEARLVHRHL